MDGEGPEDRVFDDAGNTCCMWDGCGKPFAATQMANNGTRTIGNRLTALLTHEAQHVKGDAAAFTGFKCPQADCTFTDPTSAAVWAHASEAHSIEEDKRRAAASG